MNTSNIKSFSVQGLFGTDDVHIPFDDNIKILVGENGLGKTQVLNLFYYTLKRNFFRLGEFSFDKLILEFDKRNPIEISKDQVDELIRELYDHPLLRDFIDRVGYPQLEMLRNRFIQSKGNRRQFLFEAEIEYDFKSSKFPVHHIFRAFERLDSMNKDNQSNFFFTACEKQIESGIEESEIMYFPTYRRVEEDLYNLGYNNDDELLNQENTLIQFGMNDVQKRFNNIQNTIDRLLKEGFSEMSSEILSQLIEDEEDVKDSDFLKNIEDNDVEILLSRVGNRISEQKKQRISELLLKKEAKPKDSSLNFFIKKLIEIYSSQKELDNSVKLFRDVCNKYLINKQVFYDESAIKIFIKSERNSSDIPLSKLSSGEKQIISMFSRIYLSEGDKRFIVLFDEPELSLSMPWQKRLLPDILNSGKCEFLLAVTHSPFIFDNELDKYAIGLNEYVKPSQVITA